MIALTGGIGSGKSTVAERLCLETGFFCVSADKIAAELLGSPGEPLVLLRHLLGDQYFCLDGTLDREKFRHDLFLDAALREKVDKLLHPIIFVSLQAKGKKIEGETGSPVIAEIPLLYEAGWQDEFSAIIVVYASRSDCLKRLMKRDNLSFSEAERAIDAQKTIEEKVALADFVIDNSGTGFDTVLQIKRLGRILLEKSA